MSSASALDCRQRLIRAATDSFKEEGYRASIDRIATRAGVSRQSIYNHFQSKSDLFSEVARSAAEDILVSLDGEGGDIRESLIRFGAALRQRLIGDEGLAMFRTISAEAPHFPVLGKAFFDKGSGQTVRRLAEFLEQAARDGELRLDSPVFAAEMLVSMLTGFDRTRRLFGAPMLSAAEEEERLARIVDCFLRAFARDLHGHSQTLQASF